MTIYKTLAIVDDVNSCDCCGKTGLKSTVKMERDDGEILHFGSTCATRHSGRDSKAIRHEAAAAAAARLDAATREYKATPAYLAREARFAEAHRQGITPGRAFADFVREASAAAREVSAAIAAKHGVQLYA